MEAVDSHRKFSAIITPLFCSHLPKWSLHRTHKEAALNKLYQQWLDGFTDLVLALHLKKKKVNLQRLRGPQVAQWWRICLLTGDAGDMGLIPVSGGSPGEGNGSPLQDSCLGKPTDRGARWSAVQGGSQRVGHDLAAEHTRTQRLNWNSGYPCFPEGSPQQPLN